MSANGRGAMRPRDRRTATAMSHFASPSSPLPVEVADSGTGTGDDFQVVLYNDDVHTMPHVIGALVRVFGHPPVLAARIMLEAHRVGRAIAQVEPESPARLHADQLHAHGLRATVERIA